MRAQNVDEIDTFLEAVKGRMWKWTKVTRLLEEIVFKCRLSLLSRTSNFTLISVGRLMTKKMKIYLYNYISTGSPHYMRPFYLQFQVYVIEKWLFSWNLFSNLKLFLVFLYANLLYEVHL